jgi:hypothetical protein
MKMPLKKIFLYMIDMCCFQINSILAVIYVS